PLPGPPRVLNLEPSRLDDVFENIRQVAEILGVPAVGKEVVERLQSRVLSVQQRTRSSHRRPRMAVIEWLDPVFCSGHWTPELVEIAGGDEVLGRKGEDSVRMTWEHVRKSKPEILVIACCGQTTSRALQDWNRIKLQPDVRDLTP